MAEAEGGAGELLCDPRVDVRIVPAIGGNDIRTQQVRQELGIGDVLNLARHDGARLFIQVIAAPVRMLPVQLIDLIIVFAHEQRLQCGQRRVFLRAHVAGGKRAIGVDRQIVADRRLHVAVRRAQAVGGSLVGPVDHGGVEPTSDGIDRCCGLAIVACGGIDDRACQRDRGAIGVIGITVRYRDVDMGDTVGSAQVEVMVEELPPGIHQSGQSLGVGNVGVPLTDDDVADHPGIGAIAHGVDAIGEVGGADARKVGARGVESGVRKVVSRTVDRAIFGAGRLSGDDAAID